MYLKLSTSTAFSKLNFLTIYIINMQVDAEHVVILSQKMCGKYKPKWSHDHVRMTILHNLLTIIMPVKLDGNRNAQCVVGLVLKLS